MRGDHENCRLDAGGATRGPSWGHSRFVLGAIGSFFQPLCGHLSSKKNDKVSEKLTLRYPTKGLAWGGVGATPPTHLASQIALFTFMGLIRNFGKQ